MKQNGFAMAAKNGRMTLSENGRRKGAGTGAMTLSEINVTSAQKRNTKRTQRSSYKRKDDAWVFINGRSSLKAQLRPIYAITPRVNIIATASVP